MWSISMVQLYFPNTNVTELSYLIIYNWSGYHYISFCSNWETFSTYAAYCMKLNTIFDTLFQKSMLISDINQTVHPKFLIKFTFYRIFVNLDVQILEGELSNWTRCSSLLPRIIVSKQFLSEPPTHTQCERPVLLNCSLEDEFVKQTEMQSDFPCTQPWIWRSTTTSTSTQAELILLLESMGFLKRNVSLNAFVTVTFVKRYKHYEWPCVILGPRKAGVYVLLHLCDWCIQMNMSEPSECAKLPFFYLSWINVWHHIEGKGNKCTSVLHQMRFADLYGAQGVDLGEGGSLSQWCCRVWWLAM